MSYILEALKQSDHQRKKEQAPDPQPVPLAVPRGQAPAERRRAARRLPMGVILVVTSGVLIGWQWRALPPDTSVVPSATALPVEQPAVPAAVSSTPKAMPAPVVSQLAPEDLKGVRIRLQDSPQARPHSVAPATADKKVVAAGSVATATPVTAQRRAATRAPAEDTSQPEEMSQPRGRSANSHADIPYWRQLPVDVQRRLPELRFSVHIYAKDPAARRVKIGDRMLREGQNISAQLRLEEIIPRGVILVYEDYRFRMNAL